MRSGARVSGFCIGGFGYMALFWGDSGAGGGLKLSLVFIRSKTPSRISRSLLSNSFT